LAVRKLAPPVPKKLGVGQIARPQAAKFRSLSTQAQGTQHNGQSNSSKKFGPKVGAPVLLGFGLMTWSWFGGKKEEEKKASTMPHRGKGIKVFSGNAHPKLANEICEILDLPLSKAVVNKFANGETNVMILESVRDCDVFVIQPTCNPTPNDYIMELVIMLDAFRRAGALRVTAVVPIFGYARQDKKDASRAPITAKVVADMLHAAGADRVIAVDLHAPQIQGFVNFPLDNLYGLPLMVKHVKENIMKNANPDDVVVVSPDVGGAKRADNVASSLQAGFAIFSKKRKKANEIDRMILVGDVAGKTCILVDDMCDTGGSLTQAADQLMKEGAKEVHAAVVHGVFSRDALDKINKAPISSMIVTDTIPMDEATAKCPKLKVLSVAPLLAESISRIHKGDSLSELFPASAHQLLKGPKKNGHHAPDSTAPKPKPADKPAEEPAKKS